MSTRVVSATEFKAKCLSLLDEVNSRGGTITVTKRGQPVAVLSPAKKKQWKSLRNVLAGKVEIAGDIVNFDTSHLWDALRKDQPK
jgi:prevent-host-death family protein